MFPLTLWYFLFPKDSESLFLFYHFRWQDLKSMEQNIESFPGGFQVTNNGAVVPLWLEIPCKVVVSKIFQCSPRKLGKIPSYDSYFSRGLKPPTSHGFSLAQNSPRKAAQIPEGTSSITPTPRCGTMPWSCDIDLFCGLLLNGYYARCIYLHLFQKCIWVNPGPWENWPQIKWRFIQDWIPLPCALRVHRLKLVSRGDTWGSVA